MNDFLNCTKMQGSGVNGPQLDNHVQLLTQVPVEFACLMVVGMSTSQLAVHPTNGRIDVDQGEVPSHSPWRRVVKQPLLCRQDGDFPAGYHTQTNEVLGVCAVDSD